MIPRYAALCSLAVMAMLFLPENSHAQAQPPVPAPTPTPEKKEGAMVRIVCVQSLSGEKEEIITLAKKNEDGTWIEFGDLELRSPFITDWVRVPAGLNHVVRKEGDKFTSLASFTISPTIKGAILIMVPNQKEKNYRLQLIDPAKLEFSKGKALIMNYSKIPALVNMGKGTKTVAPGQQLVETVTTDKDGMHPMRVGYLDQDKKTVLCYDRKVSSNPNKRSFILVFPDPDTGLRAMTLSEFGPFE